ncbi:M20 family metallopeptidase [Sporomusa termitida]|uniref:Putative succinyl-diaminopimelate desuccinylase n=1 Tax=Sporomusa termitida TaxID=2377 RepID=A0A517DZ76_9FIRM|nr:M20 family metallopeptidase [Sporomusa termitida]QDR82664.1 putative succinyl-diaminopimelate desuccinylase [Sporomusa termitida]
MLNAVSGESAREAVDLLKSILRINTTNPPGKEYQLAIWLAAWLEKKGVASRVVDLGNGRANLIARLSGSSGQPALLYTGHLDTVPPGDLAWDYPPFAAEQAGDLIYGRGASDMKGGLAAMIFALSWLKQNDITPGQDMVLLATAGEEVDCCGAQAFCDGGGMNGIGAAVVGEPSNGDVIVAHKGAVWLEIVTKGRTAHGSMPHLGINAVVHMNAIVSSLYQRSFPVQPNDWLGLPTFSVNKIQGGVATNVISDNCTCSIDFRLIPGQTANDVTAMLQDIIQELTPAYPELAAELKIVNYRQPVACPEGHPIIDKALACARRISGTPVNLRGVNFYTDASTLLQGLNLPVIFYGPGDDAQAHQPNEYISVTKYLEAINFYTNFGR